MVSFYWFDYETFGTHPAWDRVCQFAGVRTDTDLNVIGDPLTLYCRQPADYLPATAACRVTGISPQLANEHGLPEAEFVSQVIAELGSPGTCSAGYNSIRFDDEFTRHMLFRTLRDPYEHEWKDGNSRWDMLDVVRTARALRPQGIEWPVNEDGSSSNRLEHLSVANGIEHAQAHDAMSDVWATIGMARLIRDQQPRLFDYLFAHRGKASVSQILNTGDRIPCLQVSGMIPGARHHLSAILPLARHPENSNGVIILDLHQDPRDLFELSADTIAERLYRPGTDRRVDEPPRPGLRTVHINRCPVILPLSVLRPADEERLGLDRAQLLRHATWAQERCTEEALQRISDALTHSYFDEFTPDVDGTLYSGGFLSAADRQRLLGIHSSPVESLDSLIRQHLGHFEDRRLDELVWRYQARNYPQTLDHARSRLWHQHCEQRLNDCNAPWLSHQEFQRQLEEIDWQPAELPLTQALKDYARQLPGAALDDETALLSSFDSHRRP